jgi:predicted nucleotidyltransferase
VLKTVGLAEPLRTALTPLSSSIRAAFVYGSVAKASDRAASDIDLMIVSDSLSYGDVFSALERAAGRLGRQVNPTVYTSAEFAKRTRVENAFVARVLAQPKIWIVGGEHDLPVAACVRGLPNGDARRTRTSRSIPAPPALRPLCSNIT